MASDEQRETGGIMAPGPDIEAAVRAEYAGAVRDGTREAYERFIRRHPHHSFAEKAREKVADGGLK